MPPQLVASPKKGRVRQFLRALFVRGDSYVGAAIKPGVGRWAPVKYVWRGRHGVLRASRTAGTSERGRARPEIFNVSGISASANKVYFYLSRVSDVDGYAFPFVRTRSRRGPRYRRRQSRMHSLSLRAPDF